MAPAVTAARGIYTRRPRLIKKVTTAPIRNTMNSIFAMPAAPAAIPPKPKTAAINAMMKKTTA